MVGIASFGAYVPQRRLQRQAVVAANAWFNAGLKAHAKGERAMASWDEDAVTMAVEAARDCLTGLDRDRVARIVLASTSLPFADRLNSGIVKEALNLRDDIGAMDVGGSQRAGTSALLDALFAAAGDAGDILCVGSERRKAQPGSEGELTGADASAALLVSKDGGAAEFLGGYSVCSDFVDHFRSAAREFDYAWEGRWVRDQGYAKIVPAAVVGALERVSLSPTAIDCFILASPARGVAASIAKTCGIPSGSIASALDEQLGDSGSTQPLLLLAHVLQTAVPGQTIMLVGFGQGCDVLVFRTTPRLNELPQRMGVPGWLARRRAETNYVRYLFFNGQLALEKGMRAEFDQKTSLTALYRNRKSVLGLVGGRCTKTGTVQFPKSEISVAQNDRAIGTQEDYPLAERRARVLTYTADNLTYTPDPPCYYGMIEFEGGGRMSIEFADAEPGEIVVGAPMRMMFRIKALDELRGFTKYFWKAVPDYLPESSVS